MCGKQSQYSCLEKPHGQRSLADYSLGGHKESDTNEQLSMAQSRFISRFAIYVNQNRKQC